MKKPQPEEREVRKNFEDQIQGVSRDLLSRVLDGANELGRWRSFRIRQSWKQFVRVWSASEDVLRNQYCD